MRIIESRKYRISAREVAGYPGVPLLPTLAGNVEGAGAGYVPLQAIADEMTSLLQTMETKLRTKA